MTTDTKHTPTPWEYDGQGYIFGPDNEMIAELRGFGGNLPMDINAAFIVKSANCHDELVAALEEVKAIGMGTSGQGMVNIIITARAALAKAKE